MRPCSIVARAVPRDHRGTGGGRRSRRRPDTQARRNPQRDAGRRSAGLLGARVLDDLRCVAPVTLLLQSRPVRSGQGARVGRDGHSRARGTLVLAGQLPKSRVLPPEERPLARRPAVYREGRQVHLRRGPRGARRAREASIESKKRLVRERRRDRDARRADRDLPAQAPPNPRFCCCWPRATRRSIRRTCRWPTCASAASAPVRSSSRSTYAVR
jgi:hypothetical protein